MLGTVHTCRKMAVFAPTPLQSKAQNITGQEVKQAVRRYGGGWARMCRAVHQAGAAITTRHLPNRSLPGCSFLCALYQTRLRRDLKEEVVVALLINWSVSVAAPLKCLAASAAS